VAGPKGQQLQSYPQLALISWRAVQEFPRSTGKVAAKQTPRVRRLPSASTRGVNGSPYKEKPLTNSQDVLASEEHRFVEGLAA
jgi:hypothetical protein